MRPVAGSPAGRASVRNCLDPVDFFLVNFAGENVAGKVEVDRAALAVERLAKGDADVFGDAIAEIDAIGAP